MRALKYMLFATVVLLAACVKKPLQLPQPVPPETPSRLAIAIDWQNIPESFDIGSLMLSVADTTMEIPLNEQPDTLALNPGTYLISCYTHASGITIQNQKATIQEDENGNNIPNSGAFFSSHQEVVIAANKTTFASVLPLQQNHFIWIVFDIIKPNTEVVVVDSISGALLHTASTYNIPTGALEGGKATAFKGLDSCGIHIFGITGSEYIIDLVVYRTHSTPVAIQYNVGDYFLDAESNYTVPQRINLEVNMTQDTTMMSKSAQGFTQQSRQVPGAADFLRFPKERPVWSSAEWKK